MYLYKKKGKAERKGGGGSERIKQNIEGIIQTKIFINRRFLFPVISALVPDVYGAFGTW